MELKDLKNDLSQYMSWEDRTDADIWAWPGAVRDSWYAEGNDQINHVLDLDASDEERQMARLEQEIGIQAIRDSLWLPEYDEIGYFVDAMAKPCPEEPDGPEVPVRLRLPKERVEGQKLPVYFLVYGGGTSMNNTLFDAEMAQYQKEFNCAVVVTSYRWFPENRFPKPINDLHAAYLWVVENADKYGLDADCIVLGGQSLGGQYSVALAHRLKRYGTIVRGVVAAMPIMDDRGIGTSALYNVKDDCGQVAMRYCIPHFQAYVGYDNVGQRALSPEAFPNHASVDDVRGMPPMSIHAGESDPLRDGAIDYAQKLLDAGVFCALHVWPGAGHFIVMNMNMPFVTDPYQIRYREEYYKDIQAFFEYDFRRP